MPFRFIQRAISDVNYCDRHASHRTGWWDCLQSQSLPNTYGIKNEVIPVVVLQVCYLLDVNGTCTEEQKGTISSGTAVIKEYMVVDRVSTGKYLEIVGGNFGDGAVQMDTAAKTFTIWKLSKRHFIVIKWYVILLIGKNNVLAVRSRSILHRKPPCHLILVR